MSRIALALAGGVIAALLALPHAQARDVLTAGRVGLVPAGNAIYGFSSPSGAWTLTHLDGHPAVSRVTPFIGYVRTARTIYAYNPLNQQWHPVSFDGSPAGEDVEGVTALFWSDTACYGISTLWTSWASHRFDLPVERPAGGGSAEGFAAVWTNQALHAYVAGTGAWTRRDLARPPLGGIVAHGLALVWTADSGYVFAPTAGRWVPTETGGGDAVGAAGEASVGLIWTGKEAHAFSASGGDWVSLASDGELQGGSASGETALVWSSDRIFGFSSSLGSWSNVPAQGFGETGGVEAGAADRFRVERGDRGASSFLVRLPAGGVWTVDVVDSTGVSVRSLASSASASAFGGRWDGRDARGRPVRAGVYWVRAASGTCVEARRIVVAR